MVRRVAGCGMRGRGRHGSTCQAIESTRAATLYFESTIAHYLRCVLSRLSLRDDCCHIADRLLISCVALTNTRVTSTFAVVITPTANENNDATGSAPPCGGLCEDGTAHCEGGLGGVAERPKRHHRQRLPQPRTSDSVVCERGARRDGRAQGTRTNR
jgi:hypothetical protein